MLIHIVSLILLTFAKLENHQELSVSQTQNTNSLVSSRLKLSNLKSTSKFSKKTEINSQNSKKSFLNTLNKHIFTESNDDLILIQGEDWKRRRESFATGILDISDSYFYECIQGNAPGGAIFSLCETLVTRCKFTRCSAYTGGCICVYSDLYINKSIFQENNAKKGGALYNQYGCFSMNDTSFDLVSASETGGVYDSHNNIQIQSRENNFTRCSCTNDGAAMFVSAPSATLKQLIVVKNMIKKGSGSIYFDKVNRGELFDSIFFKCIFQDIVGGGGSCVEATGPMSTVSLLNSIFCESANFNFWSIRGRKNCILILIGCNFSLEKRIEVNCDEQPSLNRCEFDLGKNLKLPKIKILNVGNPNDPEYDNTLIIMSIGIALRSIARFIPLLIILAITINEIISFYIQKRSNRKIL